MYKITQKTINIMMVCECDGLIDANKKIMKLIRLIVHDVALFEAKILKLYFFLYKRKLIDEGDFYQQLKVIF